MPEHPFICPNCGADLPAKARACPECGSDDKTGWSANTVYDGTDIVDPAEDQFDYEDWKRRERGGVSGPAGRRWVWWAVGALLLVLFVWMIIRSG